MTLLGKEILFSDFEIWFPVVRTKDREARVHKPERRAASARANEETFSPGIIVTFVRCQIDVRIFRCIIYGF